jgi:hypothetical protein
MQCDRQTFEGVRMQGPPTEGLQMIAAGCLDSWFCHDTLISPAPLAPDLRNPWSAGRSARATCKQGVVGSSPIVSTAAQKPYPASSSPSDFLGRALRVPLGCPDVPRPS